MKKFNGGKVTKYDDGALQVCKGLNKWSGFITTIPEFRDLLLKRLEKEKLVDLYNPWRDSNDHLVGNRVESRPYDKDIELRKAFSDHAKLGKVISYEEFEDLESEYEVYSNRKLEEAEMKIIEARYQ